MPKKAPILSKTLSKIFSIFDRKPPIQTRILSAFAATLLFGILFTIKAYAADTTAPVTTATKNPASPNGHNQWYVTPVKVTLNATDLESGVKEINYKIDTAAWVKEDFSNPLNLAPNPSFELSEENPPLNTKDWKIGTTDEFVNYTSDTSVYKPDFATTSVKITSTGGTWHAVNHSDSFAVTTPYSNMSAYAWLKTENATDSAFFKIYAISQVGSGPITITPISTSSSLTGTNDWTKVSLNFVASVDNTIGVYMEVGLNGAGTVWIDAVSISGSINPTISFSVATDGEHTIQYYSVDNAGNTEGTKNLTFKIDQTPPGNWRDSGAVRALVGNDHELYVWTHVYDATSGLSTLTDKFQYTTRVHDGFGRFSTLDSCSSTWEPNGWAILASPPFLPGSHSAYLITPKVDFCDSNWKICKYVRFYSEDMAGNVAIKDMCINGPWIKVRGKGIVRANQNVDMISEAYEDNTDGLIETGGPSINFFNSSSDLYMTDSTTPPSYDYEKFFELAPNSKTQISTSGDLVSSSGVYLIDGDYEITNSKVPNNYGSATFNQIVFVDGRLRISSNVQVANVSTALFIVKGDVEVVKAVSNVGVGIFTDGTFYSAYNITEGEASSALTLKGVFTANKFVLQRTLQGTQNEKYPSDDITYEPKYLIKLRDYIGVNSVRWVYSE